MEKKLIYFTRRKIKKEAIALLEKIEKNSTAIETPAAQEQLGSLINNISYISKRGDDILLKSANIAFSALTKSPHELEIAKQINEYLSHRKKAPYDKMTPSTKVILGLCFCFYLALSTLFVGGSGFDIPEDFFGINSSLVLLAAGSGAIGSIISIMSRVGEFVDLDARDHMVHFFTGLFKPLIGTAFAIFVFSLVKAGIIPIDLGPPSREVLVIFSLAFLSGFSERFAKDFTQKAGKALGANTA